MAYAFPEERRLKSLIPASAIPVRFPKILRSSSRQMLKSKRLKSPSDCVMSRQEHNAAKTSHAYSIGLDGINTMGKSHRIPRQIAVRGVHMTIRAILLLIACIMSVYIVGWTISYSFALGSDFTYYFIYLYYAWTGPSEIPGIINFYASVISLIEIAFIYVVWRLMRRYRHRQRRHLN